MCHLAYTWQPMKRLFRTIDERIEESLDSSEGNHITLSHSIPFKNVIDDAVTLIIGVLIVILIWWSVGSIYNTFFAHSMLFPMPDEVFDDLLSLMFGEKVFTYTIWQHIGASLERWTIGFLIAALIGSAIGFIVSLHPLIYKVLMIPVNILQMIPGLAWLPVVLILFGFGNDSAIFIVGVVAIAPIAINVSNGLRNVPKVNRRVAEMSELSRWDTFLEVLLPFSVLDIITGLRIGLGSSWRMIIAAEMVVGVMQGIGFTIKGASDTLDYTTAFACIIVICAIGLAIDRLFFNPVERYVRKRTGVGDA